MLFAMVCVLFSSMLLMTVAWLISKMTHNSSWVDFFWAPALFQAACMFIFIFDELDPRSFFLLLILTFWAIRLTSYVYWTRVRKKKCMAWNEDNRWKNKGFLYSQSQAVLVFIMTIPFCFISHQSVPEFDLKDFSATVACLIGIIGETVSDIQLQRFKKINPEGVCRDGLWYYSRHPNYFFDWMVWVGYGIFSLSSISVGWLGLISPVALYCVLNWVSIPIAEKRLLARAGHSYVDYQRTTSAFFPNVFKLE